MPKIETTLKSNIPELMAALPSQIALGLTMIGEEAEGYAKDECPVDTGRLRNSIANKVIKEEQAVYVGTNVEYGVYVEYGDYNHKTGNKHFLKNAVCNHTDRYESLMKAALSE